MRKKKLLALPLLAIAIIAIGIGVYHGSGADRDSQKVDSITVSYDYPVAANLQQMVDGADYIVVGEYVGFNTSWNMARNPDNIDEADSENYVEGRLYDFNVDSAIKGNINDTSILINHRYSETISTVESNAEIDAEGRIIKEATESKELSFDISSPFFIEPEYNCKYILFLSKDDHFQNYYAAIEPFAIKITDGTAALQSNLLNKNGDMTQSIKTDDSKEVIVIIDVGNISIKDEVTGKSSEEVIRVIKEDIKNADIQSKEIDNNSPEDIAQESTMSNGPENIDELLRPYQDVLDRLNSENGYKLYIPEDTKVSVYEAYKDMTPEEFEAEILKQLEEEANGNYSNDSSDIIIGGYSDTPSD